MNRTESELENLATTVFIAGAFFEGWDGLWGIVLATQIGTQSEIRSACKRIVLDSHPNQNRDVYFPAAGVFRIFSETSPKQIDREQIFHGNFPPPEYSVLNLGIYEFSDECLKVSFGGSE